MSKELKITGYQSEQFADISRIRIGIDELYYLDFNVVKNATPAQFIKHLRSMIWAIEKKVIENED